MNLTQLLHRNVQQRPDQPAVSFRGTDLSYRELEHRVARLASAFRNLGLRANDRIALLSMNAPHYVEFLLAVPWAGGVINPINVRWSVKEIAYSLRDSGSEILLVDHNFASLVPEITTLAPDIRQVIYAGEDNAPANMLDYEALIADAEPMDDALRSGDDLAAILYTGGTTGQPKGVMLSHANLMVFPLTVGTMTDIPDQPVTLHCAPLFHIAGLGMLLASLMRGGHQILVPGFDPAEVTAAVRKWRVTATLLVPTMVQMLLDSPDFKSDDFASLKTVIYGASPMPLGTLDHAARALPHTQLVQGYGMTECGLITMSGSAYHTEEARKNGLIASAGVAGPVQQVKIVNKDGSDTKCGEVGEVVTRGPNVMQGYWGRPEVTAKTVVNGWLHTGDGGKMDEAGRVFIVDRVKDMIISGGENIYSAEVETVITQHHSVSQCAVIGIPSDEWGEAVHAVLVLSPERAGDETLSLEMIRDFCEPHLAAYKTPRSIEVVDALPVSGAGKILKTQLRKPYWADRKVQVA